MQIWFIGRTLASQAGKAGSTPVICFKTNVMLLCQNHPAEHIYFIRNERLRIL